MARKAGLPQKPEDYKLELPSDFELPPGIEYKLDTSNPGLGKLQQVAHKYGMHPDAVKELLGIYAGEEVASTAKFNAGAQKQREDLGSAATQRIDNSINFIKSTADPKDVDTLILGMSMAAQVRFVEKIQHMLTTQGTASFTQSHRAPPDQGIPGFEKMSFEQKRQAQDQRAAQRRTA